MDTNHPTTLSERIAWARKKVGLSKRGLSRLAGLDPSHVRQLEARGTRPAESTITAIAEALDVPRSWLYFGEGSAPTEAHFSELAERLRADGYDLHPVAEDDDPTGPVATAEEHAA